MLLFDRRTGPELGEAAPRYPAGDVPEWFRDAKFGVFVHWGLYSVPGWATPSQPDKYIPSELEYSHHQYAEWYANTVRITDSPTQVHHEKTFGVGTSYEDLADSWRPESFDPAGWMSLFADCGARYVIPTTKHHDGFCLWNTATTGFNSAARGPRRDIIAELAAAARGAGMRFGTYYSGALDWHVSSFPPIQSLTDLFTHRRNDERFAQYCFAQAAELIDRYSPDVLWNDIDWPDAAKPEGPHSLAALFARYFAEVPDGVVNDRWGVPYLGYRTREYRTEDAIIADVWEATRGLGASFGYNSAETDRHLIAPAELVHLLVDTVSKNGNLLLNIGPRGDGSLPQGQVDRLRHLGDWLGANGSAIYGTRPWQRHTEPVGAPVRYTAGADGALHVIALDPSTGTVSLAADVLAVGNPTMCGESAVADADGRVEIPQRLRGESAVVVTIDPS